MPFLSRPDERFGGWSGPGVLFRQKAPSFGEEQENHFLSVLTNKEKSSLFTLPCSHFNGFSTKVDYQTVRKLQAQVCWKCSLILSNTNLINSK